MDAISAARDQLHGALLAAGNTPQKTGATAEDWHSSDDENLIDIQLADRDGEAPVRRRRRRRSPPSDIVLADSYVMKLFDRSVDLARFTADAPLYTVCRAWMSDDPQNLAPPPPAKKQLHEPGDEHASADTLVYSLPPPEPMARHPVTGQPRDPRIPTARPTAPTGATPLAQSGPAASQTELLSSHLTHWRHVRQRWRQAAAANEARYSRSMAIIDSICVPDV